MAYGTSMLRKLVEATHQRSTKQKTIDEKLAVMRAWLEGEKIESCSHFGDGEWYDNTHPWWDWDKFDYRVKPSEPIDDYINWDHVSDEFKFMARDESGFVFLYREEPYVAKAFWTGPQVYIDAKSFVSLKIGNKPWNESLVKRP